MLPNGTLSLGSISVADPASSKKRVLEQAARLLAAHAEEPAAELIFERLLERERLGSTGLAGGVALPHARMPGIDESRGAFLRLAEAVEFDALDGQPTKAAANAVAAALGLPKRDVYQRALQLKAGD